MPHYFFWKNKMSGSGIKSRVYSHKGKGDMMMPVDRKFKTMPYKGIVPFYGEGAVKHISDKVRKVL